MRKINKIFIIALTILIATIGCKNTNLGGDPDPNIDKNGDSQVEDRNTLEEEQLMEEFLDMIKPETRAVDLGKYIKENISKVGKSHGQEMIEWLTIYQTEIIKDFNEKIYKPVYLEPLNDMGWILDEDRIENIDNEEVKEEFQNLMAAYLTIVRYEETPVVETDWKGLAKLSDHLPEDLGETLKLYDKIQNYEYERSKLDVDGLMEDMIKTESILEEYERGFINNLANKIYDLQTYALLVGPEGSYLEVFLDKNGQVYEEIIEKKQENPNTLTAGMIEDLQERKYEDIMDVYDAIEEHLKFGIKSNDHIINKEFKKDNIGYNIFQVIMKDDQEKQKRINNIIEKDIEDYISELENGDELIISIRPNFQGNNYLSYGGFVDYPGEDYYGNQKDLTIYRTFDYINEEYVRLEDYLGIDLEELEDYLQSIKGIKIDSSPEFQLSDRGIDLVVEGEEGMEKYIHLNNKDLVPYLDLDQIINK